jgi:hypothetical protein
MTTTSPTTAAAATDRTAAGAVPTLDLSGTPRVPFARLVRVELRKMYDTRAGLWLLVAIGVITAGVIAIMFAVTDVDDRTFFNFLGATGTPQGVLLPVLGILLVTSEWGQRTTLTTFALEPSRARVVAAKVVAALVLGLASLAVAVAVAALAALLGGAADPWGGVDAAMFAKFVLAQGSGVIQGLAYGMVLLNSAAAIVVFFVVPIAFNVIAGLWSTLAEHAAWVDIATAQSPLFMGADLTGEQWAQLASASAIWILLPFVAGLWRVLRTELK